MPPYEILLYTSVGNAELSCCQRNHNFTDSRGERTKCDRITLSNILGPLVDAKVASLFDKGEYVEARHLASIKHWLLRGLPTPNGALDSKSEPDTVEDPHPRTCPPTGGRHVAQLKELLRWGPHLDDSFGHTTGFTTLKYAILNNNLKAVQVLLLEIAAMATHNRRYLLEAPIQKQGYPKLGLHGGSTNISMASLCVYV